MATLRDYLNRRCMKKYFIMDRNDAKCYILKPDTPLNEAMGITYQLELRHVEMAEFKSSWAFIILDRIPGKEEVQWM